jgi:hypothetical protein
MASIHINTSKNPIRGANFIPLTTKMERMVPRVTSHKRAENIISGMTTSVNDVEVRNRKDLGLGIQYQYNFHKDLYLGGRVDSNGGTGVSLGVGF